MHRDARDLNEVLDYSLGLEISIYLSGSLTIFVSPTENKKLPLENA